jgi:hypothetical protein
MEALSGFASGIAIVSLSLQLIQTTRVIKTFAQNVKDAPKELERLVASLGRLEALLEAVCTMVEQQSSLQGQHFPAPSKTISNSLESCKKSLQPLLDIVAKFAAPQSQLGPSMAKLKVSFGLV